MKNILISLMDKKLYLYDDDKLIKSYNIAVGKPSSPTPTGSYKIIQKSRVNSKNYGTRWIRIYKSFGIHGTYKDTSIGKAVTHSCIRMFNRDIEELYKLIHVGTPVKIVS